MELKVLSINVRDRMVGSWQEFEYAKKSRVYFRLKQQPQDGKFVDSLYGDYGELYPKYKKILQDVLETAGLNRDEYKANWSKNCGCNCGCSPGFLLTPNPDVQPSDFMISRTGKGHYYNKFGMSDYMPWYKLKRLDIYVDVTFDYVSEEGHWLEVRHGRTYGENTYHQNHFYGRSEANLSQNNNDEIREFFIAGKITEHYKVEEERESALIL